MATVFQSELYDRFLDYVVEKATPREILAFSATAEEQARVEDLLERNSAGALSEPEQAELEQLREFNAFISVLKARALAASQD